MQRETTSRPTGTINVRLFRLPGAVRRAPSVDAWLRECPADLGAIARRWFEVMRLCGDDVRELLPDGHPTACVGEAAFAYVNVFSAHVNVGFFAGSSIADPEGLLEGTGRFMRHVKVRPGGDVNERALTTLINVAYDHMKACVREH